MTVGSDHWLEGAKRVPVVGGSAMSIRRCAVVHYTSGASAISSINYWKSIQGSKRQASAHVIIDRDGTVIQCRPFNRRADHAGTSRWRDPKTGKLYVGLNSCSIGVELANAGDDEKLARRWSKMTPAPATHRNGGRETLWEIYPEKQIDSCVAVLRALVARYNLDDITGHDCIAPERKTDPGPLFPMREVREACGFSGLPVVYRP
jgi:N-acetyl-anhydromuramyl-L-alanine amidase AmpD